MWDFDEVELYAKTGATLLTKKPSITRTRDKDGTERLLFDCIEIKGETRNGRDVYVVTMISPDGNLELNVLYKPLDAVAIAVVEVARCRVLDLFAE